MILLRMIRRNIHRIDKKYFLAGIISVFFLFGFYSMFFANNQNTEADIANIKTSKVVLSSINQTIKVLGKAELVDEQKLRFNQVGKIAVVHFQNGDNVKKDQVIAELDKTEVFNEIRQSEISLQNSSLSLQELLKGNTEVQILKSKNSVLDTKQKIDTAEKSLEIAKQEEKNTLYELENEIVLAEKDVSDKEKSLENSRKDLENNTVFEDESTKSSSNTYIATINDALLEVKDYLIEADNILTTLDSILGMETNTKDDNNSFEDYLGALNTNTKKKAESSYSLTKGKIRDLEVVYNELESKEILLKNEVVSLLEMTVDMLQELIIASDYTYIMLQNTITGANLSSSELDSYKSSASNARSSGQSNLNNIKSSITSLSNLEDLDITELRSSDTIRKKEDAVRSAEYALEKSKDTLKNLKNTLNIKKENKKLERVSKENDLNNLKNTLNAQEKESAELERGETEERVTMARNDIIQKELALSKVKKNVEKYELRAPFDGILRKIDFKTGDNLIADDDKFVYIENPDLLKITILLDQIDIVKVEKEMESRIIFDALPEKTFIGKIEEIDQTPIEQSGVVSYEASITLNKENEKIFSGMTSSIEIVVQEKNDVLIVPNLAITNKKGKSYVKKTENKKTQEVEVEIGITDGKNTEIISGVEEGDEIVEIDFQSQNLGSGNQSGGQDTMRQIMRSSGGH